jgi:hypothetical protein
MEENQVCSDCVMKCKAAVEADTQFCPKRAPKSFSLTDEEREKVGVEIGNARDERDAKEAGRVAKALCQRNLISPDRRRVLLRLSAGRERYLRRQRAILGTIEVSRSRGVGVEMSVDTRKDKENGRGSGSESLRQSNPYLNRMTDEEYQKALWQNVLSSTRVEIPGFKMEQPDRDSDNPDLDRRL